MRFPILRAGLAVAGLTGAALLYGHAAPEAEPQAATDLRATIHPPVTLDADQLWMAPSPGDRSEAARNAVNIQLQVGLRAYAQEHYTEALKRFAAVGSLKSALRDHAAYYAAVSELRLNNFAAAREKFAGLKNATGFISEAAALGEAEALLGLGKPDDAATIYSRLLKSEPVDAPAIWLSLANAELAAGDRKAAAEAFLRLYYEFPLSEHAVQAEGPLQTLAEPIEAGNTRYKLELGRAERLFGSARYPESRNSFNRLKPVAADQDADLVTLRLAEIDYFQNKYLAARQALTPFLTSGPRQAEARFFYLMSQRGLRNFESFDVLVHALANDFPDSSWTEEALNHLATYYIREDQDDQADEVLREIYLRFPRGKYAERAAWKAGWNAYRKGNMREAAEYFESAAGTFPRSDYRPSWLYWSGRARENMNDRVGAVSRYQVAISDYQNTYYGRLATAGLKRLGGNVQPTIRFVTNPALLAGEDDHLPPTAGVIRTLLALGLYEPALKELEFARDKWGESPAVLATMAWTNKQMSASENGTKQFTLARGSITMMKRAYPQFMASGGENLPREIQTTIFPLSYWELIRKYSAERGLDPYLIAALMAQESTFVRDIRSHANAYGLMQLLPSTARQYARKLKLRYSTRLLTTPETNVQIGTAYFADKIKQFGSVPMALASYNAGETAVRRWASEKPGLPVEEFIDDIPYPETQQYVKRIVGTAEDYRRLYGPK